MPAFLAWPSVVLILGLVAIFVFRQPLSRFIDRARKVGKCGVEAGPPGQEVGVGIKPSPADELLKVFDNTLLVQREQFICAELDRQGIKQTAERERVLVRHLAGLSIAQSFEAAYSYIWGSQLAVLQFLNSAGAAGVAVDQIQPWYQSAASQSPDLYASYTFDQWLGYLESHSLIRRAAGAVAITLEGREFLRFLIERGYRLHKNG
jgi:hypothetical protein